MEEKKSVRVAVFLGGICSVSYLAVYIIRNMLSAVTPQLIETTKVTNEDIGVISSAFFVTYAVGQLVNGILGDKIKAKYMVGFGLFISALMNWLLCVCIGERTIAAIVYGMLGFFLSMIYAPMVKIISENTKLHHAENCNLALAFAALFGTPVAGVIAGLFSWKIAFYVISMVAALVGGIYFISISRMEKNGLIQCQEQRKVKEKEKGNICILLKRGIVLFTLISALTGIIRTAVMFWFPTYISQYLGFDSNTAAFIFSAATLVISVSSFVGRFFYERLHRNMRVALLLFFSVAAMGFFLLYFIKVPVLNVALITLAVLASNCASSMIWVVYCPSLRDTGMVSTATGYLDFISYIAAAVSNLLFTNAVSKIGWRNLILVWAVLMGIGVVAMVPKLRRRSSGSDTKAAA